MEMPEMGEMPGTTLEDGAWFAIFRAAIEAAYDAVLITDADLDPPGPRIVHANPAFSRMTGYARDELIGQSPRVLQGPQTDRAVIRRLRDDLEHGRHFEGSTYNYRKDGSAFIMEWSIAPVTDGNRRITHYVALQRDVTERHTLLEMLRHQAVIDGLTGATNRTEIENLLDVEIRRAERYGTPLTAVLLDIDHFKTVNDRHGHNLGDEVLKGVSDLVRGRLRSTDHFGRWGGEEFVVLLPQTDAEGARSLAEDLRGRLAATRFTDQLRVTASFGVCAHIPGMDASALVGAADQALYRSKQDGRDRVTLARDESRAS